MLLKMKAKKAKAGGGAAPKRTGGANAGVLRATKGENFSCKYGVSLSGD
jgi:hypothetical protein